MPFARVAQIKQLVAAEVIKFFLAICSSFPLAPTSVYVKIYLNKHPAHCILTQSWLPKEIGLRYCMTTVF